MNAVSRDANHAANLLQSGCLVVESESHFRQKENKRYAMRGVWGREPKWSSICEQCGTTMELRCAHCGTAARPGARFCVACGQPLQTVSPSSTETVSRPLPPVPQPLDLTAAAQAFEPPAHLAEKIRAQHSALEGERRQVTVLFGDIAGFTAISEKLDPEDLGQIVQRGFELITAEIHRFEGTINLNPKINQAARRVTI